MSSARALRVPSENKTIFAQHSFQRCAAAVFFVGLVALSVVLANREGGSLPLLGQGQRQVAAAAAEGGGTTVDATTATSSGGGGGANAKDHGNGRQGGEGADVCWDGFNDELPSKPMARTFLEKMPAVLGQREEIVRVGRCAQELVNLPVVTSNDAYRLGNAVERQGVGWIGARRLVLDNEAGYKNSILYNFLMVWEINKHPRGAARTRVARMT